MLDKILEITEEYKKKNTKNIRKNKGQFFTPPDIAIYMAEAIENPADRLSVLDPGCGNAMLTAALIYHCIEKGLCFNFNVTLVETDTEVLKILPEICHIIELYVADHGGAFRYEVITENFITYKFSKTFDVVICNPPYKKLRKDSAESKEMDYVVYGQPNLYGLFMAKAASLLQQHGQFIFITPRSWTSGQYYMRVREYLYNTLNIIGVTLFDTRNGVFTNEQVLQETMILVAKRGSSQGNSIVINTIFAVADNTHIDVPSNLVINVGSFHNLLLPGASDDVAVLQELSTGKSFKELGYIFKTGPVVEFRNLDYLYMDPEKDTVPMYRSANVINGECAFPVNIGKFQYVSGDAQHLLVPNTPTVFVKRITSKEEARRLQCCSYIPSSTDPYIAVENHLNYLARTDGKPLAEKEVNAISKLLSSDVYDQYYRIIGGSTQVNAGELNELPVTKDIFLSITHHLA